MVLVILLGVLSVILFLSISDFVISSMPTNLGVRKSSDQEQKHSETAWPERLRFAAVIQGVIKAIGTAFGGRPSGRKVTDRLQSP
jgi:hypothetical protein